MSDRPAVTAEMWIGASPQTVWELVTDVARMGEWSPENEGGRWLEEGGPVPGARFESGNRRGGRHWTTTSTVLSAEPGRAFEYAVNDPADPAATWSFALREEAGGTRLVQRVRLGPGPSGLTRVVERHPDRHAELVAGRMEQLWRDMHATLEGIKAAAEAGSGPAREADGRGGGAPDRH